eukprot:Clim_evm64s203 gene=Clim_evmTU64s203
MDDDPGEPTSLNPTDRSEWPNYWYGPKVVLRNLEDTVYDFYFNLDGDFLTPFLQVLYGEGLDKEFSPSFVTTVDYPHNTIGDRRSGCKAQLVGNLREIRTVKREREFWQHVQDLSGLVRSNRSQFRTQPWFRFVQGFVSACSKCRLVEGRVWLDQLRSQLINTSQSKDSKKFKAKDGSVKQPQTRKLDEKLVAGVYLSAGSTVRSILIAEERAEGFAASAGGVIAQGEHLAVLSAMIALVGKLRADLIQLLVANLSTLTSIAGYVASTMDGEHLSQEPQWNEILLKMLGAHRLFLLSIYFDENSMDTNTKWVLSEIDRLIDVRKWPGGKKLSTQATEASKLYAFPAPAKASEREDIAPEPKPIKPKTDPDAVSLNKKPPFSKEALEKPPSMAELLGRTKREDKTNTGPDSSKGKKTEKKGSSKKKRKRREGGDEMDDIFAGF